MKALLSRFLTRIVAYDDASDNDQPDGTGASWADVAVITPVQASSAVRMSAPMVRKNASGKLVITVPVPSEAGRMELKSAGANTRR